MGHAYESLREAPRRRADRAQPRRPAPQVAAPGPRSDHGGLAGLTPDALLALQRSVGNAAVNEVLRAVAARERQGQGQERGRGHAAGARPAPAPVPPGLLQRHPVAPEPDGEEDAALKREQEAEEAARAGALQRTVQAVPGGHARARPAPRSGPAARPVLQRKTRWGNDLNQTAGMVASQVGTWVTKEKKRLAPAIAARSRLTAQAHFETLWASATATRQTTAAEVQGAKVFLKEELEGPHADLAAVLTAAGERIDAAERAAKVSKRSAPVWANRDNVREARQALLTFEEVTKDLAARQGSPRLGRLLAKQEELRTKNPKADLGDAFLAVRAETGLGLKRGYVPEAKKAGFAKALEELPAVQYLLGRKDQVARPGASGTTASGAKTSKVRLAASPAPQWKDGGSLADPALRRAEDDALLKGRIEQRVTNNATLTRRLSKADMLVKHMAGRAVLADIDRPTFKIHTRGAQSPTNWTGQRAFHAKGDISLGYDTPTNVIMHEVGHVLEEHLPDAWHDTRLLLDKRHEEAGGGTARRGPVGTMWSEGTYAGSYVTGRYTATDNASGGTEVFSQAMEYFTSPKTARELIDGDPLHAAIILRALDPAAYARAAALRAYDRYLPSGYGADKAPEKAPEAEAPEKAPEPKTPEKALVAET